MARFVTRDGNMGKHFVDKDREEETTAVAATEAKAQKFFCFMKTCQYFPIVDSAFEAIVKSYVDEVRDVWLRIAETHWAKELNKAFDVSLWGRRTKTASGIRSLSRAAGASGPAHWAPFSP